MFVRAMLRCAVVAVVCAAGCGSGHEGERADAAFDGMMPDGARRDGADDADGALPVIDPCVSPRTIAVGDSVEGDTEGGSATDPRPDYTTCFAGRGADAAFRFTAQRAAVIEFVVSADFDAVLSIRESCRDRTSILQCRDAVLTPGGERVEIDVDANDTFYVLVDGYRTLSSGHFTLSASEKITWAAVGDRCNRTNLLCRSSVCDAETNRCVSERCLDNRDDDSDWHTDCADPECHDTAVCVPGDGELAAPCDVHNECARADLRDAPVCLRESTLGFPAGICAATCNEAAREGECPNGTVCIAGTAPMQGDFTELCLPMCETDADCPRDEGYRCEDTATKLGEIRRACFPRCDADSDCPRTNHCDLARERCAPIEVCDNDADDDGDRRANCEDSDCFEATECAAGRRSSCADAAALVVGRNEGTTDDGPRFFPNACENESGDDSVWQLDVAPSGERGIVALRLDTGVEQALVVRDDCEDVSRERECVGRWGGAIEQVTNFDVVGGEPLYVYVDADGSQSTGSYVLQVYYAPNRELEPNDTPAEAQDYGAPPFGGRLGSSRDVDWYRVAVPDNGAITASLRALDDAFCMPRRRIRAEWDPAIEIFSADGTRSLAFDDDIGANDLCPRATVSSLAAGDYLVKVSWSPTFLQEDGTPGTGPYLLDVEVTP